MLFSVCIEAIGPDREEGIISEIYINNVTFEELEALAKIATRHNNVVIQCVPVIKE